MLKIALFTANRAEYGLLAPLARAIHTDPALDLLLLVAQDHWLTGTVAEIEADGFAEVILALRPNPQWANLTDPGQRMTALAGDLMVQLSTCLMAPPDNKKIDALVILGDRFEAAACALAARLLSIPILHIGGGDVTEGGCVDDDLRDVISRLSAWHAVSSAQSAERLKAIGIPPERISQTGSLVVDNLRQTPLIPKADLCQQLDLDPDKPILLFTQHPIPAEGPATVAHFRQSLEALSQLPVQVVATYPNMDGFAADLKAVIAESRFPHFRWVVSLGHQRYLSVMAISDAVVGNTSSGLIETPFFGVPSVTIGPRQAGRERASNVLACDYGAPALMKAVNTVLHDARWRTAALSQINNPFHQHPAAPQMIDLIKRALLS